MNCKTIYELAMITIVTKNRKYKKCTGCLNLSYIDTNAIST